MESWKWRIYPCIPFLIRIMFLSICITNINVMFLGVQPCQNALKRNFIYRLNSLVIFCVLLYMSRLNYMHQKLYKPLNTQKKLCNAKRVGQFFATTVPRQTSKLTRIRNARTFLVPKRDTPLLKVCQICLNLIKNTPTRGSFFFFFFYFKPLKNFSILQNLFNLKFFS